MDSAVENQVKMSGPSFLLYLIRDIFLRPDTRAPFYYIKCFHYA